MAVCPNVKYLNVQVFYDCKVFAEDPAVRISAKTGISDYYCDGYEQYLHPFNYPELSQRFSARLSLTHMLP